MIQPMLRQWAQMYLSLAVLLCAVTGSAYASQTQDDEAARRKAGEAALRAGRYPQAITIFTELAARDGTSPVTRRLLLRALSEVGRYQEAEKSAREFIANDPPSAALQRACGEVL